jgi:hypothetical protein
MFLVEYNSMALSVISNYDSLILNLKSMSKMVENIQSKTKRFQSLADKLNNKKDF